MSPVPSRRLVTTGSLTLALALAAPTAAVADPRVNPEQGPTGAGEARSDRASGPRHQATPAAAQTQAERRRGEHAPAGEPAAPQGQRKPAGAGSGSKAQDPAAQRKQRKRERGPAKAAPRHDAPSAGQRPVAPQGQGEGQQDADPAGNNGTVKIDGEAFDSGRGNEPHVGCVFQLDFYGFDAGDTASVTFTGHAPTRTGVLHSQTTTISDDAAGGGQDRDATLTYSVDDQLSELLDVPPHPKQGWHVKVAVDVDDAPGGAKQKVFWISCDTDQAPAGQTPTTPEQPRTPDAQSPTTSEDKLPTPEPQAPPTPEQDGTDSAAEQETVVPELSGETESPATGGTLAPEQPTAVAVMGPQAPAGEDLVVAQTAVSGTTVQAATGAAPTERAVVPARGAAAPATLPFTGVRDLAALLAVGVGALGLGGLANRLGRREALAARGRC